MKKYCIIPARSGSKGLPNKNILFFDGKPLIQHSIDAAINSCVFGTENVYLSTDSKYYFDLVRDSGVSLHFRGEELSNDSAPSSAFITDFLKREVKEEDAIIVLCQPTSPLRYANHIKEAVELFERNQCDSVISVTKLEKSPRLFSKLPNGTLSDLKDVDKNYRRQDEEASDYYYPNGAIFVTTKKTYSENTTFYTENTLPYVMDSKSSVDVDGVIDFQAAVGIRTQDFYNKYKETIELQKNVLCNVNVQGEKVFVGDSRLVPLALCNQFAFEDFLLSSFYEFFNRLENKEVHIMLGVNDFQYGLSAEDVIRLFEKIINALLGNNCVIYIYEIFNTLNHPAFRNEEIRRVNLYLSNLSGVTFVQTNRKLSDQHGLKFEYTIDGIQLNEEGNKILKKIVCEFYGK